MIRHDFIKVSELLKLNIEEKANIFGLFLGILAEKEKEVKKNE